jgi:hypothetical protein
VLTQVPSGLIIPPEPLYVAWYDGSKRAWSNEFITDTEYIPDKRYGASYTRM